MSHRYTTSPLSTSTPRFGSWIHYYGDSSPRLMARVITIKQTKVVELTNIESPFGAVDKKNWRIETEATIAETYE